MAALNGHGSSDGNIAATYALIYSFLTARSHDKAAAAVKKAAKDIIILKDDVKTDEPELEEIVKWWKTKKEADANHKLTSTTDSDSSSSDDSDSDSSSSSSSSSTSDDSSDTNDDSSGSSSISEHKVTKPNLGAKKSTNADAMGKSVASAAAESINLSKETGKVNSLKQTKGSKPVKVKNPQDSGSNDSSGNSSDSSNESDAIQAQKDTKKATSATTEPKVPASDALTPLAKSDTTRTTKKRRLSENGKAVATAVITTASPALDSKLNGKKPRKSNTPFRRIKAETVEFYDERLKDNAFVSKGGSTNDYGARANQDLIVTRGDGFRKEKNKKKRGSYRGGEITMQSHSIKFT